jgi:hypothetical protein
MRSILPITNAVQKRAASLWTAQASGRGNLALSGFMPCNQGRRAILGEHRAGAGEARLVAFQSDGRDLANDAFSRLSRHVEGRCW